MEFDLKPVLKALLVSTGDPLDPKDIQKLFSRYVEEILEDEEEAAEEAGEGKAVEGPEGAGDADKDEDEAGEGEGEAEAPAVPRLVTVTQIREALEALQAELEATGEAYRIVETHQGFRLVTAPEYADWVRLLRNAPRPLKLSPAAMETLSIIAYRQPVTRAEMETIRGVSVDSAVNKLLELDLVQVIGRAELPGRPLQYGTTEKFLEFAGIRSTEELPASDIITQSRLDTWIRQANQQHAVSDEDVGLPSVEAEAEDADAAPGGEPEPTAKGPVAADAPPGDETETEAEEEGSKEVSS